MLGCDVRHLSAGETAARAANAHGFITHLRERYTVLRERGMPLSCGEKRRLSTARAILEGARCARPCGLERAGTLPSAMAAALSA